AERSDVESFCFQQKPQRCPDIVVVIDDVNHRFPWRKAAAGLAAGAGSGVDHPDKLDVLPVPELT
ncbi:MAG: hypothetical protein ABWY10_14120, partial [Tardiphaga sp.]